jgi:hypothetical protein
MLCVDVRLTGGKLLRSKALVNSKTAGNYIKEKNLARKSSINRDFSRTIRAA